MANDRNLFRKTLATKKTLLFHNYDLFLERQTRLFAKGQTRGRFLSQDVNAKADLLLLDDLTIFAIAARRLIDLCGLQSYVNDNNKISLLATRQDDTRVVFVDVGEVGFYNLINRLIHMTQFEYFESASSLRYRLGVDRDMMRLIQDARLEADALDGVFFVKEAKHPTLLVRLKDVIDCSSDVADKLTDTCSDAGVHLDFDMRLI